MNIFDFQARLYFAKKKNIFCPRKFETKQNLENANHKLSADIFWSKCQKFEIQQSDWSKIF